MANIQWLSDDEALPNPKVNPELDKRFPGLFAITESLNSKRLIEAYRLGMFPWYSNDEPVMWWSLQPRMVLETNRFFVSHSLRKKITSILNNDHWEIRLDHHFENVMRNCANIKRPNQQGTWITDEIIAAYSDLHRQHKAHSIETWHQNQLVGGLYCVNIGNMVFGESMFSHETDASKLALAALSAWAITQKIRYIDCQQETQHLASLGARPISRDEFIEWIELQIDLPSPTWQFDKHILEHWL